MCGCLLALFISYENLCFPFWLKLPYRATQWVGVESEGRGESAVVSLHDWHSGQRRIYRIYGI